LILIGKTVPYSTNAVDSEESRARLLFIWIAAKTSPNGDHSRPNLRAAASAHGCWIPFGIYERAQTKVIRFATREQAKNAGDLVRKKYASVFRRLAEVERQERVIDDTLKRPEPHSTGAGPRQ
jgi:hypothetical protein